METKLDSAEEVTKVMVAEVHLDQPLKERKSKKHNRDSMALPNKCACHNFADGTPQESPPGQNASCSATYPGENQRPIPVHSNNHREYRYDGFNTYEDAWQSSKDFCKPRLRFTPYYECRRFKDNASVPYGHHPSGPFTSNLNVASRRQRMSFQDAFHDACDFQDAFRQEFNKVCLHSAIFL
jgi:hypothetical protein